VIVETERLVAELVRACADAGIAPGATVTWVVDARRPPGTTPIAYLQPEGAVGEDTVLVFRAVGAARAARFAHVAHRLAVWRRLPGIPDGALGPMLRHELEHARRFEASGPAFYAADERLRAAAGEAGYARLPTEREANAAASAYAARTLDAAQLAELRACADCAWLVGAGPPPGDVVAETLAALGAAVPCAPAPVAAPPGQTAPRVELVPAPASIRP
jgi:hypothetical protein